MVLPASSIHPGSGGFHIFVIVPVVPITTALPVVTVIAAMLTHTSGGTRVPLLPLRVLLSGCGAPPLQDLHDAVGRRHLAVDDIRQRRLPV
jgi:hypothetical protein